MEILPNDVTSILSSYLTSQEQLSLSLCAKSSPLFPFDIERSKHLRLMSAKILLTYMAIGPHGPNNPLYNDEEDLENDLSSWEILLPSEKQEQAFEYLSYFAETFMDDYKYPMFSFYRYAKYKRLNILFGSRYKKGTYALSRQPWGTPQDKSTIINRDDPISATYNLKSPSRQMRLIMKSLTLKALVG
mgnify:FL=1|tara:strand:- start:1819 stop:2382 length:564 start_codon:yes stop_codon:yes gene_type:complete